MWFHIVKWTVRLLVFEYLLCSIIMLQYRGGPVGALQLPLKQQNSCWIKKIKVNSFCVWLQQRGQQPSVASQDPFCLPAHLEDRNKQRRRRQEVRPPDTSHLISHIRFRFRFLVLVLGLVRPPQPEKNAHFVRKS